MSRSEELASKSSKRDDLGVLCAIYVDFQQVLGHLLKAPEDREKANAVRIFKKGKWSDPDDYTPVSLRSILSKVKEQLMTQDATRN